MQSLRCRAARLTRNLDVVLHRLLLLEYLHDVFAVTRCENANLLTCSVLLFLAFILSNHRARCLAAALTIVPLFLAFILSKHRIIYLAAALTIPFKFLLGGERAIQLIRMLCSHSFYPCVYNESKSAWRYKFKLFVLLFMYLFLSSVSHPIALRPLSTCSI